MSDFQPPKVVALLCLPQLEGKRRTVGLQVSLKPPPFFCGPSPASNMLGIIAPSAFKEAGSRPHITEYYVADNREYYSEQMG